MIKFVGKITIKFEITKIKRSKCFVLLWYLINIKI